MIDNICDFERISFMDGFSEYNQIKMYSDDENHTSFQTPLGVFCYTVMLFSLKNARATYQRAMSIIFRDHLWKCAMSTTSQSKVVTRTTNYMT